MAVTRKHGKSLSHRVGAIAVAAVALAAVVGISALPSRNPPASAEATNSVAKDPIVTDNFTRTVKTGWGSAQNGGTYKHSDPKYFKVDGTAGIATLPRGGTSVTASLMSVSSADTNATTVISLDKIPAAGNGIYAGLQLRSTGQTYYQANLRVAPNGDVTLNILRVNGSTANQTALARDIKVGKKLTKNVKVKLEFEVTGTSPVTLQARAFLASAAAPKWQATATDTSANAIKKAGAVGLWSYVSSATNGGTVSYQDLQASRLTGVAPVTEPAQPAPPQSAPAPPVAVPGGDTSLATGTPGVRNSAGSATIGSTRYAVPAGAIFVATNGNDSWPGTQAQPYKTVKQGVAKASSGKTIVVRAGSYHETIVVPTQKRLTIQSYPGEAVWLDGSRVVGNWTKSGASWVSTGWTNSFDASPTYFRGRPDNTQPGWAFVNPDYPMAAHPDQVWIDGAAQAQVGSLAKVAAGKFYVDYATDRLYLGSDPTGKTVKSSDVVQAITIAGPGSVLRGIGIRNYSPSVPDMGAVIVAASGATLENVAVINSATSGLAVFSSNVTLRNVSILRSGMLGGQASQADGLQVIGMLSADNNQEHFNRAPVAGGLKIHKTRGVVVKDSDFRGNFGNSLWFDESVYNMSIIGNDITDGTGYGLVIELSATAVVADNIIANNGVDGIFITDSGQVQIWNNTITGNEKSINLTQDARRASNLSTAGHDTRQRLPDPTVTWITGNITVGNNVLSDGGSKCILCVEDYSHERSAAQMNIQADGNVYQRKSAANPTWSVVWSRGAGNPAVYHTVDEFNAATGRDANSIEVAGTGVLSNLTTLTDAVNGKTAGVARGLPAGVASLVGQVSGAKHLGAWK